VHQRIDALQCLLDFLQRLTRRGRRQLRTTGAQSRVQHGTLLGCVDGRAGKHRVARSLPAAGLSVLAQRLERSVVQFLPAQIQQDRPRSVSQPLAAFRILQQITQMDACKTIDVLCQKGRTALGRHGFSCMTKGNPDLTQLPAPDASTNVAAQLWR
jgi:hypothetical protein